MKFAQLILALTLVPFTTAFAAPVFELSMKTGNLECTVSGTTVTKKVSYLYGTAGYTVTKEIAPFGLDPVVQKAASSSRGIFSRAGYLFIMKMDGSNYGLNTTDSTEAMLLISMLNEVCSF